MRMARFSEAASGLLGLLSRRYPSPTGHTPLPMPTGPLLILVAFLCFPLPSHFFFCSSGLLNDNFANKFYAAFGLSPMLASFASLAFLSQH